MSYRDNFIPIRPPRQFHTDHTNAKTLLATVSVRLRAAPPETIICAPVRASGKYGRQAPEINLAFPTIRGPLILMNFPACNYQIQIASTEWQCMPLPRNLKFVTRPVYVWKC
jgi:hypothetical protein